MKRTIKMLAVLLAVLLVVVMVLGFRDVIPMPTAMNVVVVGVFIGGLLALLYNGQVDMVKRILLSLVIEAEQIYGSGTGKLKYNYVMGKIYAMMPSVIKLVVNEQKIDELLEAAVDCLQVMLEETSGVEEEAVKTMGFQP